MADTINYLRTGWHMDEAQYPSSGTIRPHSPKACTCEGVPPEVHFSADDVIGLWTCEVCGGGRVVRLIFKSANIDRAAQLADRIELEGSDQSGRITSDGRQWIQEALDEAEQRGKDAAATEGMFRRP